MQKRDFRLLLSKLGNGGRGTFPSHAGPDPLDNRVALQLGDRPTISSSGRIEAPLRELRSERLGLLRISIP